MVHQRTYFYRRLFHALLSLVVLTNVLLPMYAPLLAGGEYKIPICTTAGIKYVNASEVGGGLPQKNNNNLPHCPLCVLSNASLLCAPNLIKEVAWFTPLRISAPEYAFAEISYVSNIDSRPSAPRAPPSSLL